MTEEEFWAWFQSATAEIETFIIDPNKADMSLYEELTDQIKNYNELISPEITGDKDGTYVLVLTCDGNPNGVYPIQKLAHFAPSIPGWRIQQFRQPGLIFDIQLEGLDLKPEDFLFRHWMEGEKHAFDMYMPDYDESDKRFQMLAFLYLDHYLGEFNVITKVESIGFKRLDKYSSNSGFISLLQLQEKMIPLKN